LKNQIDKNYIPMNIQKITTIEECRNVLTNEIKTFPDWPQKGVNFKDIQSI